MLKTILDKIRRQSEYKKSVLTLMSGTFAAQLIPVLVSPLLTRLYSPTDFGVFTLIVSIVSFGAILATGRYEIAIMLPKEDNDANALFFLSILINAIFSSLLFFLILFESENIAILVGLQESRWLYLIPLMIFLTAAYQSVNYIVNRRKKFKLMAANRVGKSAVLGSGQLLFGFFSYSGGLIVGVLISLVTSILTLLKGFRNFDTPTIRKVKQVSKRYSNFPKYSLWADGVNSFSNQLPVFFLLKYFSASTAGLFGLTIRILGLPISLISSAALDVFKQRASEDYNREGNCTHIYLKTLKNLFIIAVPAFTIVYFFAPQIFAFVFGDEWREAGEFAQILTLMFFFRFIASPLSYVIYIVEKQQYDLIWQITLLIVTLSSFFIGSYFKSVSVALWCFSVGYSIMYLFYIALSYKLSKGNRKKW